MTSMSVAPPPLHTFIDSNVFLSFYAYPKSDVDQLGKISTYISLGLLTVYITDQLRDEILRNRDKTIFESIQKFSKSELAAEIPLILSDYPEAEQFRAALKQAKVNQNKMLERLTSDANSQQLNADRAITKIIDSAVLLRTSEKNFHDALTRMRLGNPPGKSSSTIGDELNWELLLDNVPPGKDLIIVTGDTDFTSKRRRSEPNQFLSDEWKKRNGGTLSICEEIGVLLTRVDGATQLQTQKTKDELIEKLINARSFQATHAAIARLDPFIPLINDLERERIAEAFSSNSQIAWVSQDADVKNFFTTIFSGHLSKLEKRLKEPLEREYFNSTIDDKQDLS